MSNPRKTCILPAGKLLTKSMAQIMNFPLKLYFELSFHSAFVSYRSHKKFRNNLFKTELDNELLTYDLYIIAYFPL